MCYLLDYKPEHHTGGGFTNGFGIICFLTVVYLVKDLLSSSLVCTLLAWFAVSECLGYMWALLSTFLKKIVWKLSSSFYLSKMEKKDIFLFDTLLIFVWCWGADLRVLNEYPQMQMFSAFSSIYNSTGLFGIQATTVSVCLSLWAYYLVQECICFPFI